MMSVNWSITNCMGMVVKKFDNPVTICYNISIDRKIAGQFNSSF